MDLAQAVSELGRHKVWLAIGAIVSTIAALATAYSLHFFPPSLQSRSFDVGSATTQLLVDNQPTSALSDLGQDTGPLTNRAAIYARFMTSAPVLAAISREAKLPPGRLSARGPDANEPVANQAPPAEQRTSDLRDEAQPYRLFFDVQPDLPIVRVFAQAPRADEAIALANASAGGLRSYVDASARTAKVPGFRRVAVTQLGAATGGSVTQKSSSFATAFIAFLGVLIGWCILVLVGSSFARAVRQPAGAAVFPVRLDDTREPRSDSARSAHDIFSR